MGEANVNVEPTSGRYRANAVQNYTPQQQEAMKHRFIAVGFASSGVLRRLELHRPTLKQNFDAALDAKAIEKKIADETVATMFDANGKYIKTNPEPHTLRRGDEFTASGYASNIYAAGVILIANNLLQDFAAGINAQYGAALQCGIAIAGVRFSMALWAAGNAFRHQDEWGRKLKAPFTPGLRLRFKQAFASIDPLRQILPSPYEITYFSMVDVLEKLSDANFDLFMSRLTYAVEDVATRDQFDRMAWDWGRGMHDHLQKAKVLPEPDPSATGTSVPD